MLPIPVLTNASTAKEPTPPIQKTATVEFASLFIASLPRSNSDLKKD